MKYLRRIESQWNEEKRLSEELSSLFSDIYSVAYHKGRAAGIARCLADLRKLFNWSKLIFVKDRRRSK